MNSNNHHQQEIAGGERFKFGENWAQFLRLIDESRITEAVKSLQAMLGVETLVGKNFLDIGSGSGLFSLAAKRLGARVVSFDYDPQSVACAVELKRRYFEHDTDWQIFSGSVLDQEFLQSLGKFDVVYSWGVLHHTGHMWKALANVELNVSPDGKLFISLYNDQGSASKIWWRIKKVYCSLPTALRWIVLLPCYVVLWGPATVRDFVRLKPFAKWRSYAKQRGMSPHRDVVDWVGGFPFEVARPEEVFDFYYQRGFKLLKLKTCAGGLGCNEFVFQRELTNKVK